MQIEFIEIAAMWMKGERGPTRELLFLLYSKMKSYECSIQVICVQLIGFLLLCIFAALSLSVPLYPSLLFVSPVYWNGQRIDYHIEYLTEMGNTQKNKTETISSL